MGATAPSIYLLAIGTISSLISTSVAFVAPFSTSTARAPGIPAVPLQKRTSTVPVPSSSPKHALGCSAPLHSRLPQGRAVTARGSAVAGELSMATPVVGEEEMKQWAEGKFPGCSTVVSTATRLSGLLADVWETLADSSAVVDANSPRVL
ncbi:unnamed protein product, partial [Sphacelaria rigidula]